MTNLYDIIHRGYGVHCKNRYQASKLLFFLSKHDIFWYNSNEEIRDNTKWDNYKREAVYFVDRNKRLRIKSILSFNNTARDFEHIELVYEDTMRPDFSRLLDIPFINPQQVNRNRRRYDISAIDLSRVQFSNPCGELLLTEGESLRPIMDLSGSMNQHFHRSFPVLDVDPDGTSITHLIEAFTSFARTTVEADSAINSLDEVYENSLWSDPN